MKTEDTAGRQTAKNQGLQQKDAVFGRTNIWDLFVCRHHQETPEKKGYMCTVWKFHDFSITQILREINFGDSRSAKSAILTHLEALNFDFYEFLHFLKAEFNQ